MILCYKTDEIENKLAKNNKYVLFFSDFIHGISQNLTEQHIAMAESNLIAHKGWHVVCSWSSH